MVAGTVKHGRRLVITVAGLVVLLLGLVLIALPVPGPAVLIIPISLKILALEFLWARRILQRVALRKRD
ncbi:MAG: hypothetical protein HY726_02790 [Candidatus Rokubacteria bacterium]|nr:hypothetical protein [Candidatus Rokubacteria bacterium]